MQPEEEKVVSERTEEEVFVCEREVLESPGFGRHVMHTTGHHNQAKPRFRYRLLLLWCGSLWDIVLNKG